jgi:hypothetical protein
MADILETRPVPAASATTDVPAARGQSYVFPPDTLADGRARPALNATSDMPLVEPDPSPDRQRELRAVALDAIRDAVARGDEPGEVTPRDLLNQAAR